MLRCPVCVAKDMVVLELEGIEVDHCVACGGVWLDAGETELLAGRSGDDGRLDRLLRDVAAPRGEKRRPCPVCGKRMLKSAFGDLSPDLVLDRCPAGHGVWFDDGELSRLLSCEACGADARIVALVKDMFSARIPTSKGG